MKNTWYVWRVREFGGNTFLLTTDTPFTDRAEIAYAKVRNQPPFKVEFEYLGPTYITATFGLTAEQLRMMLAYREAERR